MHLSSVDMAIESKSHGQTGYRTDGQPWKRYAISGVFQHVESAGHDKWGVPGMGETRRACTSCTVFSIVMSKLSRDDNTLDDIVH